MHCSKNLKQIFPEMKLRGSFLISTVMYLGAYSHNGTYLESHSIAKLKIKVTTRIIVSLYDP